jgi:hypothetical protein
MQRRVLLFVLLLCALLPLSAQAQGSLCQIDLSDVNAILTRAQAAAAGGDAEDALALIVQADQALAAIESRCDLIVVEPDIALEQIFTSQDNTFSVRYPADWVVGSTPSIGAVTLGTDENAANALQSAEPNLAAGQRGALIVFGTPAEVAGSAAVERSLDGIISHFASQLAASFLVRSSDDVFVLNGRAAGSLEFTGEAFDGMIIVVEIVEGSQYALVAGASASGEIAEFRETLQAIAASVTSGEAAE